MSVMSSKIYGIDLIDKAIVADYMNRPLPPMRYKTFVWPNNPSSCSYTCDKAIVKHKYPELDAVELEDLDPDGAIISGSGEFFGFDAYNNWNKLNAVFRTNGPGEFYHPIFGDVIQASLKRLNATLEPRSNYVAYTFEFWEHKPPVIVKQVITNSTNQPNNVISSGNRGDWVTQVQNVLITDNSNALPKYGVDGKYGSETETWVRKYQAKHNLTISGICDNDTLKHMGISYTGGIQHNSGIIYVVKSGDTLSRIASIYNKKWKDIASFNNIKNPHLIHPGDKIKIPD